MTMKGIAERAGVGRQTVYRWWSTKAEILLEASAVDALEDLQVPDHGEPAELVAAYLRALSAFLANSPAGQAYRALIGAAQQDAEVAELISTKDVFGASASPVVGRALGRLTPAQERLAIDTLVGPVFFGILNGHRFTTQELNRLATLYLSAWSRPDH
jgi:AcrR family transcriptional regulator